MKVCDHLLQSKEKLLCRWEQLSIARLPEAQNLSRTAIRDHIPQVYSALCEIIRTGIFEVPEELSKTHGRQRSWSTEYSLAELMAEYSILKNVIFDEITVMGDVSMTTFRLIDRFFDVASSIATTEFVALREHELNNVTDSLVALNLELETFAAVAAHDLRSPAATIISFTELLDREANTVGDVAVKAVSTIKRTARRMLELIDQLLSYAKIGKEHLARTSFSLQAIAHEAKELLTSQIDEANAQIKIENLPDYEGDPVLFRQLFQNLLSNSLKFRSSDRPCSILVSATKENGNIQISIKDNGVGFDSKISELIFQPFKRGDNWVGIQGSGLGLATAKKIVELHGGSIKANGQINSGAEIKITLLTVN